MSAAAPLLLRLDHVQLAMPAGGEHTARAFYADLLGLPETVKPPNLAARGGVWFRHGPIEVHLGIEADFRAARKAHPAFRVSDLDGLRQLLLAAGVDVADDDHLPGERRFYAADPFGNRLEFMADRPSHAT